ncbi:stage II sporulation protein GA (sporulation sigma-E factor processing peptidase) [Evansella vedderi]|uniref:Stage II sporulation protein GA (Sporulation sigma-E factor processing peptidase) n=1 Tax=Evansella vedderi TaxID=38282 RepID=A0ABT9ZTJ6_9BACI|nr:sigma-E processing peptidase SpoIIGA [Evansella vedderi]MDQ0253808.1 stage II sporulation protein GA (sporulation sigma-E factor processing peptidase) [Evansella vedderi]
MAKSDTIKNSHKIYYVQNPIRMVAILQIYLDVIWLLNFLVDFLLLSLTSIVLKRNVKRLRLLLGAFIASLYVFFLFTPYDWIAIHPVVKSIYSILIIFATFGFYRFRLFIQAWLTFFFVNFAVGGGLLGLHFFLETDTSFINGTFATQTSGFGSPISWLFVLIGFPVMYWYSKQNLANIETEKIRYDQIYPVLVKVAGIHLHLKGFVDSGNRLEDPFTRKAVMIIDMTDVGDQFPDSVVQFTKKPMFSDGTLPERFEGKLTMVPFRTVGEKQQFLWAIRPDEVVVYDKEQSHKCGHVLLGLSYIPLSDRQDYNCLLHPKMMQQKKQTS